MEPYTIEDIEILRQKSGLSYQEAVALLDYHNGSLARALIDLEKHGKLKNEENAEKEGNGTMNSRKAVFFDAKVRFFCYTRLLLREKVCSLSKKALPLHKVSES